MEDIIGYGILIFAFCVAPLVVIGIIAVIIIRANRAAKAKSGTVQAVTSAAVKQTPAPRAKGTAVAPSRATPTVKASAAASAPIITTAAGEHTPIYLNFSNKPQAIMDSIDALVAQANKANTTRTRWSKGPRILFWLGLALMLLEGLFFLLGYTPTCTFLIGGIALWIVSIFLSTGLKRAQVKSFPPRFNEFKEMIHALRDDLRPGTGFLGNLDLTGAKQSSKVARAANDTRGRTTNYYRDQWLNFKAKLYDGNVMRVSAIQRVKERNGYWGRGKVSGKSKWKPSKPKGSYQELKVRIAVNPELYSIARNNEIKSNTKVGEYTINAVDTEGGLVTVLASSPNENVSSESVLGVMKFAYEMLKLKKA